MHKTSSDLDSANFWNAVFSAFSAPFENESCIVELERLAAEQRRERHQQQMANQEADREEGFS